ncbi:MAG TPA: hypothetical protein ENF20_03870 [Candidatus Marinimicrobia bacterium]|nr:hypothetical protein [Candidatus Neomarinimicrobiota bacterium]
MDKLKKRLPMTLLVVFVLSILLVGSVSARGNECGSGCGPPDCGTYVATSSDVNVTITAGYWDWPTVSAVSHNGWEITRISGYADHGYKDTATFSAGTTEASNKMWMYYIRRYEVEITKSCAPKKVYVCKYAGQPGVDEFLKPGKQPIEVSIASIDHNDWDGSVPGWFNDAHDRSYVLGYVPMVPEPTAADCPVTWNRPDPRVREYNICEGVFFQNQEWVGGPDGGYEDVGDPALLHAWSDPFDYEVWGDWVEPTECHDFNIKKIERSDCDGYYRKVNLRDGDTWIKSLYMDQGSWSDPFITEKLSAYTFPVPDVYGEDVVFDELSELESCLDYDWGIGYVDGGCGFDKVVPWVSGNGWYETNMPGSSPYVFSWVDPYSLERYPEVGHYTITFHWPNGHVENPYPNGFYFYESPECLRHLTSVDVVKVSCDYRKGTEYAFFLGEGILQVEVDGKVLTESDSVFLMPGNYHWVATLKEGYDAEGPLEGDLDVKGCEPELKCPECGEHVDESNVGIYGPGLAIAWTGTDGCVVDLQKWCIILPNTVRAWSLDYFEFTDQPETEVRNGVDGNTWYVVSGADPAGEWRILNADGQPYRNYGVEDNPVYKFSACSVDAGPWDTHNGKGIIDYGHNQADWGQYLIQGGSCYPNTYAGYEEAFDFLESVGIGKEIHWSMIGKSFDLPDSCSW